MNYYTVKTASFAAGSIDILAADKDAFLKHVKVYNVSFRFIIKITQ